MRKKKYYFIEDGYGGQHGTTIEEIKLTIDEFFEVKNTGVYNGRRGHVSLDYEAALYYIYD